MLKWLAVGLCCVAISACAHFRKIPYEPKANVSEPNKVIERVIKQQPSSYTTVPYEVSAKSDCIVMTMTEPGGWFVFGQSPGTLVNTICYRNIGKVTLNKTDIFYVEVYDRAGNWLCYVYSFDESDAKLFIDALHTMMDAK
jgi:hypothetical protein